MGRQTYTLIFSLLITASFSLAADVYESYPIDAVQQGKDEYQKMKNAAKAESMVDYIFGTDCYSKSVRSLQKGCKLMTPDEHATLAFLLTNCFLDNSGRKTMLCKGNNIRECTSFMDEETFATYQHFFINIFNICLFLENDNFQKQTEHLVRELYETTGDVFGKMSEMKEKMSTQENQLKGMFKQVSEVMKMQQMVEEGVSRGIKEVIALQQSTTSLEKQMHESLEVEAKVFDQQKLILDGQEEQERRQEVLNEKAEEHYQTTEGFQDKMDDWQKTYQEMQDHLMKSSETLMSRSDDLKDTLVKLLEYEAKTEKAIRQVLGRSFKVMDLVIYVLGMIMGLIAGSIGRTHRAGGPIFAVFCAGLIVHRFLSNTWSEAQLIDSKGNWFSFLMRMFGSEFRIGWLIQSICILTSVVLILSLSVNNRTDTSNLNNTHFYVLAKYLKRSSKEIRLLSDQQEIITRCLQERLSPDDSSSVHDSPFRFGSHGPHAAAFERHFRSLASPPSYRLKPSDLTPLSKKDQ